MSCMHIMSMPIFYRCIKYCIHCFVLVFCFFADKTLSWCEIRQVLRMCTASLFSGEHPLLSLVVASYLSALPLYILALCLRCFSIPILFACSLAASYYPIPTSYNPLRVYMLALRVLGMLRLFQVCLSNLKWLCYFRYNFTWCSFINVGVGYN